MPAELTLGLSVDHAGGMASDTSLDYFTSLSQMSSFPFIDNQNNLDFYHKEEKAIAAWGHTEGLFCEPGRPIQWVSSSYTDAEGRRWQHFRFHHRSAPEEQLHMRFVKPSLFLLSLFTNKSAFLDWKKGQKSKNRNLNLQIRLLHA